MKRRILALTACALLGSFAADVKLATRDWVIAQLAKGGIHVSTATTTHNTNGTFTVEVPFTSDTLTNCASLSLTFTDPAIVSATPVLRKSLLRSAGVSDNKVQITLTQGAWKDKAKEEHTFNIRDGYVFTWPEELPEVPSEDHVCELNGNCYCIWYNRGPKYPDDYPEEYRLKTMDDFDNASFADIVSWIDTESWTPQTTIGDKTIYFLQSDGGYVTLDQIQASDAWRNGVAEVEEKINERLRECCQAFLDSCECKAENPQHDWQTTSCGSHSWRVCRNNPAHKEGTEQHQYPGSVKTEEGHSCVCGERTQAHAYGSATVVSRIEWIVRYRKTCAICAYALEWEDDTSPCRNGHVPLTDDCGCACGYFSPTNNIAADEKFHHWTSGGANGNPACLCDCGHKHKFKNITQYESNRFPTYTNCTQCLGVCWECRERDMNGNIVPASSHTAFTTSEARGAARCGCRCGKVSASENGDSRFHYRNSTGVGGLPSCRCYGANAKASGASPGSYHYYSPSACPKVCSVEWQGKRHLTTTSVFPENTAWTAIANVTDHEKKDTGTTCGCKCGYYNNINWRDWNGKADFHRVYNSCCCGCPAQHHIPITRDGCTLLCGGNCTGLYEDKTWRQSAGALFDEKYHFPSETACACKCNYFHGTTAPSKFHSVPNSQQPCFCECKAHHKFTHRRSDCPGICSTHGDYNHVAGKDPPELAGPSNHSFAPNSCTCLCPAKVLRKSGHLYPDGSHTCYCGNGTITPHNYKEAGEEVPGAEFVCEDCEETITPFSRQMRCTVCGDTYTARWETGHAPGCGMGDIGGHVIQCAKHTGSGTYLVNNLNGDSHTHVGVCEMVYGWQNKSWQFLGWECQLGYDKGEDIRAFEVTCCGSKVCEKCMEVVNRSLEIPTGSGGGTGGDGGYDDI